MKTRVSGINRMTISLIMYTKYFISALLLFAYGHTQCQNPISRDSLGKYSYQMMTLKMPRAETHQGTGFFYKRDNRLFFVTARHTFVQCDSLRNKEYFTFDQCFIYLPSPVQMIPIQVAKTKDSCSCLDWNRYPDIAVFEVNYNLVSKVNSVEEFMLPPFKSYGDAEIYGQGFSSDSGAFYYTTPHHIHLPAKSFGISWLIGDSVTRVVDSVDYYFFVTTIKARSSLKGFSGSPVFLQDSLSKKWRVAGVFTSGMQFRLSGDNNLRETLGVTRQDYITNIINSSKFGLRRLDCH